MGRCSRSFFFFAIILVGLLSPVTRLEDATAVALRDPLATLDDPDVDPVSPNDHPTPLSADSILPPHTGISATFVSLRHVPPSMRHGIPQCPVLSFRIPRAPPVG